MEMLRLPKLWARQGYILVLNEKLEGISYSDKVLKNSNNIIQETFDKTILYANVIQLSYTNYIYDLYFDVNTSILNLISGWVRNLRERTLKDLKLAKNNSCSTKRATQQVKSKAKGSQRTYPC